MTPCFYQGEVESLSDQELIDLKLELEEAGALSIDPYDYEETDYIRQAHHRYWELHEEQELRWELAHPVEAAKRRSERIGMEELNDYAREYIIPHTIECFYNSATVRDLLGSRKNVRFRG